jgi:hypothetical protein
MRTRQAVACADAPVEVPRATAADLAALSRRLAGGTAQEAVALDFLEDDLREAEVALGAVTDFLASVEQSLRDPRAGRGDLLALAGGPGPTRHVEMLGEVLESVRRRLGQVAARLPDRQAPAP